MSAEDRLAQLKIQLPPPPRPIGLYRPVTLCGSLAFLAGHGPLTPEGTLITGRVGDDLDAVQGAAAARQTGLAMLATLRQQFGSLDRVIRLVKLFGMVQCTPDFTEQPAVINGCSQVLADVFGDEQGIAARSAIGVAALPAGMAVEIEAIFEFKPQSPSP